MFIFKENLYLLIFYLFIEEANRILDEEPDLLNLPHGLPTITTIDAARLKQKDDDRLRKGHDLFL